MFATAVIVLPSFHEGGVVRVKHGRQEKLLDSSSEDIATTSVLSWYTDVHHEVKAVTKGFRLALAFNLIYSGDAQAAPQAPVSDDVFQKIDDALAAWQTNERAGKGSPRRLIHILSHHYSQANVSFAHLKGVDGTLVNLLREVAETRDFCVALGHLDYTVNGVADDDFGHSRHVRMAEVNDSTLSLQLISGITGVNIGKLQTIGKRYDGDSDEGDEPEDESDEAEILVDKSYWDRARPDDEEYEGYQGNGAGGLELFYHRTVVVFWPRSQNTSIITSVGGRDIAIDNLKKCASLRPTAADLDDVALALTAGKAKVAGMVADLALRWQDLDTWTSALQSCKGESNVEKLGMPRVQAALKLFKFSRLRPVLDSIVSKTTSTQQRLQFIDALEAYTEADSEEPLVPRDWIADKRRYVLSSLRKPQMNDVDPIINVLTTLPDARAFLCDTVLPQLQALNLPHNWWIVLAAQLKASPDAAASLLDWETPVFEVAKLTFDKALQHAESNQARFKLLDVLKDAWSAHEPAAAWIRESRRWAIDHLTCPTADDLDLVMNLVRAEGGFFLTTLIPALQQLDYADAFWPDLFARLDQYSREDGNTLPDYWSDVVAKALQAPLTKAQVQATSNAQFFAMLERIALAVPEHESINAVVRELTRAALRKLKLPTVDEVPLLVNKLKHDVDCGTTLLIPQLEAFDLKLDFWESMIKTMRAQSDGFYQAGWSSEQLRVLLGALASNAIAATEFPPHVAQTNLRMGYGYGYGYNHAPRVESPLPVANIKRLLALCLLAEHAQLATRIFQRVFATYTTADAIKAVVVPLVPAVFSVLQGNWSVAAEAPPFDQFFREAVRSYVTVILGKKPGHREVVSWARTLGSKCTCADCVHVNSMIASSQKTFEWVAPEARRRHVEGQLRGTRELRLSTQWGGRGRASALTVTKLVDELGPVAAWLQRGVQAAQFLRSIGSDALLDRIYASAPGQLGVVRGCLEGTASPSALSAAPFMTDAPSGSSAAGAAPVASSSAPAAGGPSAPTVPRKRKAPPVDPADVIEISD